MKSIHQRLAAIELEVVKIRAKIRHWRKVCGPQYKEDHDKSSRWQMKKLPTYNPQ